MPHRGLVAHRLSPRLQALGALACGLCVFAPPAFSDDQAPAALPAVIAASAPVQVPVLPRNVYEPRIVPALEADDEAEAGTGKAAGGDPRPQGSTGLLGLRSEIEFNVLSAARKAPDTSIAPFQTQVARIGAALEKSARAQYPDAIKHIGAFDIYVGDAQDLSTRSSGTGKLAINAGFAALNPTDDWLAYVMAREMGHVLAGHHDDNASASMVVSLLMNFVVPGSGLIKSAISLAGSQLASASGQEKQNKEADEVALKLLEGAGYTAKSVALNLRLSPLAASVSDTSWARDFRVSAARLTGVDPAVQANMLAATPASAAAPVAVTAMPVPAARWQPEEMVRTRPSGLPGPLLLGGFEVPVRRME